MRIYLDRARTKEIDHIVDRKLKVGGLTPHHHDEKLPEREALRLATMSELALAIELGGTLNTAGLTAQGDGGWDIDVAGLKIDVKLTRYESAYLIFDRPDLFKADMAILVRQCAIPFEFDIVGGISRQRFMKLAKRYDLGYGLRWVVSEFDLRPYSVIRKFIKERKQCNSQQSQLSAF